MGDYLAWLPSQMVILFYNEFSEILFDNEFAEIFSMQYALSRLLSLPIAESDLENKLQTYFQWFLQPSSHKKGHSEIYNICSIATSQSNWLCFPFSIK
jgi:hypothetical protein